MPGAADLTPDDEGGKAGMNIGRMCGVGGPTQRLGSGDTTRPRHLTSHKMLISNICNFALFKI